MSSTANIICRCKKDEGLGKNSEGKTDPLICGCDRNECFEWCWDKSLVDATAVLDNQDRNVLFNPGFSVGTVAVRGDVPFSNRYHHYFEIEMPTEVYGTSVMIGVGTAKTDLQRFSHNFVCLLGYDAESWGLSYTGNLYHNGVSTPYTKGFSQGSVIGVHLDMWHGTLEYYLNRKPLGKAFTGLNGKVLYPMASSTAARSGMNLTYCASFAPTLQLQTLLSLGRQTFWPDNVSIFKCHDLPPGLKMWIKNNFWWVVSNVEEKVEEDKSIAITEKGATDSSPTKSTQGVRRKKISEDEESSSEEPTSSDIENGAGSRGESSKSSAAGPIPASAAMRENKRQRLRSLSQSN